MKVAPAEVSVRIRRISVEQGAPNGMRPESLSHRIQGAVERALSGQTAPPNADTLAEQIGARIAASAGAATIVGRGGEL